MAGQDPAARSDDSVKTSLQKLKEIEKERRKEEEDDERLKFEEARIKAEEARKKAEEAEERRKQEEEEARRKKKEEEAARRREDELAERRMVIEARVRVEAELEKERIRAEGMRPKSRSGLMFAIFGLILVSAVVAFAMIANHLQTKLRAVEARADATVSMLKSEREEYRRKQQEFSDRITELKDNMSKLEELVRRAERTTLEARVQAPARTVSRKQAKPARPEKSEVPEWRRKGDLQVDPNITDPIKGLE